MKQFSYKGNTITASSREEAIKKVVGIEEYRGTKYYDKTDFGKVLKELGFSEEGSGYFTKVVNTLHYHMCPAGPMKTRILVSVDINPGDIHNVGMLAKNSDDKALIYSNTLSFDPEVKTGTDLLSKYKKAINDFISRAQMTITKIDEYWCEKIKI